MKIIYIHQYFYTRKMVSNAGNRSFEFARRLVSYGHEVHMITADNSADVDSKYEWYQTVEDGINVHWLPNPYSNSMPFPQRVKAFLRYAFRAATYSTKLQGDVVFATSGPLTVAVPALITKFMLRLPLVFEVRDLWPEGAIQLGVIKKPHTKFLLRMLERFTYRSSKHIIALSPGIKDGILGTGILPEKVTVIPNAADLDLFSPEVDGSEYRNRLGLGNRFTAGYFGTMGLANGLSFVLDAAAELKSRGVSDITLLLHGDGMERAGLVARSDAEGLENVIYSDPIADKSELPRLVAAVDVAMTIYKNVPVLRTCSPNKMFDAFAACKPVLTNMSGWLGDLAEKEGTGVLVKADDPMDFADKLIWLRDHPEERKAYSRRARQLAEERFDRDKLSKEFERVLQMAVADNRG